MHLWEKFGEMGLLGITAPEEYGGLGKSYLDHVIALEEVRSKILGDLAGLNAVLTLSWLYHRSRDALDRLLCPTALTRTSA